VSTEWCATSLLYQLQSCTVHSSSWGRRQLCCQI